MFNSRAYSGPLRNPPWYVPTDEDPVGEVYQLYDRIVGQIRSAFPDARLLIATGLHQVPHEKVTFYWRLKDHDAFLKKIGVSFTSVEPRMSRDFLIHCSTDAQARNAEEILASVRASTGMQIFDIDNRGHDLFVTLAWPNDIDGAFSCTVRGQPLADFHRDVVFVAIKNGEHNGIGYFLDTHERAEREATFPLKDLPKRICAALGATWTHSTESAI